MGSFLDCRKPGRDEGGDEMLKDKSIPALGGINMDFVVKAERVRKPGETLIGSDFSTILGGKGAN